MESRRKIKRKIYRIASLANLARTQENHKNVNVEPMFSAVSYKPVIVISVIGVAGVFFLGLGIGLMSTSDTVEKDFVKEITYTRCRNSGFINETCYDFIMRQNKTNCLCYETFNLTEHYTNLNVYYKLPSYNQQQYAESRDNQQLLGDLSKKPAKECEPYRYNGAKPIAPCGAVADSLFTDIFEVIEKSSELYLERKPGSPIAGDTASYRNPPGNLTEAFANVSKPLGWSEQLWTNFLKDPDDAVHNSAFENELFRGWMHTELQLKPYGVFHPVINNTVIKSGEYYLRISYNYSPRRYPGERQFILARDVARRDAGKYGAGVALLVVGLAVLVGAALLGYMHWRQKVAAAITEESAPETESRLTSPNN